MPKTTSCVRSDVISRVLGEQVVGEKLFQTIYERQIHNPKVFWAPYPLASVALDDPAFVRPDPPQFLGRSFPSAYGAARAKVDEHYGKPADLAYLMQQWICAILR
jgi:hypothetical protein